jgi:Tfp pilus assembly protein PilO
MNLNSPRVTLVGGALLLALLTAAGWFLAVGPKTAALGEVRTSIEETRAQNQLLEQQLVTLREQADSIEKTESVAEALARVFPGTADQPGLFEMVTEAAGAAGIGPRDVTALSPTPPTVGGSDPAAGASPVPAAGAELARQTVTLSVEGTYTETAELMANLERMPRAYLVTSVSLGAGTGPGSYLTTVTGDMFVVPTIDPPGDLDVQ